ncbi:MAG: serine/threonine protein kinase [Planctomycetes bacterium]|nr:serine/threonine protein kinase [Planctomycetota bacterium]MBU4399586.1 serine/threonine protein kinase [Planctomycetota bacterium]MCG2683720.1 serine/threonine protein kinase [Planctomycetales bacterium]
MARGTPGYIGPYRLLNIVHTGHASLIWQAYDDARQRIVGIKTLLEKDLQDRAQINFLHREYIVGHKLSHPYIIEIFPMEWDPRQPYFAMEWFSSPNLKQRLNQRGLEKLAPLIPKVIDRACQALAYFHSEGWVHCDIKPDNFLVTDDGEVKLIDFALAKRARRGVAKWLTPKKKPQGTKSYISPEQIRGSALDGRADLYSFACTIHELLSGKPPFTGTSSNDLLNKQLRSLPPSLEALNPNVTPECAQLIRRTMSKNPDLRPKMVDDFLMEFRMIRVFKSTPTANYCKSPAPGTDKA